MRAGTGRYGLGRVAKQHEHAEHQGDVGQIGHDARSRHPLCEQAGDKRAKREPYGHRNCRPAGRGLIIGSPEGRTRALAQPGGPGREGRTIADPGEQTPGEQHWHVPGARDQCQAGCQ